MENWNLFHLSVLGAGHVKTGKPCQDYSLTWQSDDGLQHVLIVCDGHGGSTYVRSDVGSKIAAEVALDEIRRFISEQSPELLMNKKIAVTARDANPATRWNTIPQKPLPQMTETEMMNWKQKWCFVQQVAGFEEQDKAIMGMLEKIYQRWEDNIVNHAQIIPLTKDERQALGEKRIEKAYGSTLMAYAKTPDYWLAFQIGDGRLLMCDQQLNWRQPVPWDCNCFQNFTTSLCNRQPVSSFRYAVDGTGAFPAAVICCTDGLEDSYGDYEVAPERLHNFLSGLLQQMAKHGMDTTFVNLKEFLPKLSAIGSKDDISIAGAVNLQAIATGSEQFSLRMRRDELNRQHNERAKRIGQADTELRLLETDCAKLQKEIEEKRAQHFLLKDKVSLLLDQLYDLLFQESVCEVDAAELTKKLEDVLCKKNEMCSELQRLKDENEKMDREAVVEKSELKKQHDELQKEVDVPVEVDLKPEDSSSNQHD